MQSLRYIPILGLLLGGCAVGPDFELPSPPETKSYTESELLEKTSEANGAGGQAQVFEIAQDIPSEWWHLFHSKPLNELISRAIKNSPSLQAAQASLRQAEANLRISISSLYPFVSVQFAPERQRFSPDMFDIQSPAATFNLFNATANVSYTLDVFGSIRRQIEASQAQLENQKFEVEATYLTLTSNIVTAAITEASLRSQIQATKDLILSQERTLEIIKKKFNLGAASGLDVLSQETHLAQTRASLPVLQNNLAKIRHGLAVLVGDLPSKSNLPAFDLNVFTLPTNLPISLPSNFVRQRPDIRAAEALLHAASAQIGVATANLYPQITLTGSYGWSSNQLPGIFNYANNIWDIMATLLQPVFQGGARIAQQDAAIAAFEQALAQYRQVVLQGFQNVADTLRALELDADQLRIQTEAEEAALRTLKLTRIQYNLGSVSYLNLLDAERQYQQSRIGRIQALAARYADTAALFQALGGGWWNRKLTCPPIKDK